MPVQINSELNAAGAPGTLKGQVLEFLEDFVPEGFAQVSGVSPVPAGSWCEAYPGMSSALPLDAPIYSSGIKLNALTGATTTNIQPLHDNYTLDGAAVAIPSAYGRSHRLVTLTGGKLMRIGGPTSSSVQTSTHTQVFSQSTRSWATLQPRTTAIGWFHLAVEAGDGAVFVFNGTIVDRFNNNTWQEAMVTAPAAVLAAAVLPSGHVFVVCATAQYVFNVTTYQFTPVAQTFNTASASGYVHAVRTAAGVRVYDAMLVVNALTNCIGVYDYNEATGLTAYTPPQTRLGVTGYPQLQAYPVLLNDGGVMLKSIYTAQLPEALIHRVSFTPANSVKAVKL